MDGLRWLLLVAGVIVIVGIYLVGRKSSADKSNGEIVKKAPPTLGDDEPLVDLDDDLEDIEVEPMFAEKPEPKQPKQPTEQKIVTMRLVARNRGAFKGDDLILSLRGIGMRHGKFGIFHRIDGDDDDATIFSAASLVEPGSFDLSNIKEQQIPGISLFLVLPGPIEGAEAFDMMMESARAVAQALDGELLDETGSSLSIQRERYLREEIIRFEHSLRVA
jgi:cell division protein ZipA